MLDNDKKAYIITKYPVMGLYYNFSMKDSLDNEIYDTFEVALENCYKLNGCGVTTLGENYAS